MLNSSTDRRRCPEIAQLRTSQRNSIIRFFVSLWSRMKSFLPASLHKTCDCSCTSRSKRLANNYSTSDECIAPGGVLKFRSAENEIQSISMATSPTLHLSQTRISNVPTEKSQNMTHHFAEISSDEEINIYNEACSLGYDCPQHSKFEYFPNERQKAGSFELIALQDSSIYSIPLKIEGKASSDEVLINEYTPIKIFCTADMINDISPISSATLTSKLQNQFESGDISHEEYIRRFDSVVISVIPRNLSDTMENIYHTDIMKMYAWSSPAVIDSYEESSDILMNTLKSPKANTCENNNSDIENFIEEILAESIHLIHKKVKDNSIQNYNIPTNVTKVGNSGHVNMEEIDKLILTPEFIPRTSAEHTMVSLSHTELTDNYLNIPNNENFRIDAEGQSPYDTFPILRSKRSSSLKSEKFSMNSPSRKIVRFADALGLDLETVRHVLDQENPPKIPASATVDLHLDFEKSFSSIGAKQFQLCFPQPGASPNFLHRVLLDGVSLESARVDSSRGLLSGTIRVRSFGFEKKVSIRVSYNNWNTFCEISASYVQDSYDGMTDKFSFITIFPSTIVANEKVQFAIRYETHTGEAYWDSNHGENYVVSCYAKATDMAGDGSWLHFL